MRWLRKHWLVVSGLIVTAGLLLYRLTSLQSAGGLSKGEFRLAASGGNWHHLLHDPFFLPYRGVAWLSRQALAAYPTMALRLPSVFLALVTLAAIIYILRRWYGPRTTVFGFAVIASSAALLHAGRLATVDIVYYSVVPLLLMSHIMLQESPRRRSLLFWLLVLITLLYVPGVIWLVLLELIWQRKALAEAFGKMGNWFWRLTAVITVSIGLVPLAYGFFKNLNIDYTLGWLGLPSTIPSLTQLAKNLVSSLSFIFFRSPQDPSRWLGTLPLLGAFMLACLVAGCLFYASHLRAERTQLLLSLGIISFLLLIVGGPVMRTILVPLLYIVAFGGVAYLLHFWLGMFPRNVTARWLGIGIVCLAIGLTITYNLRHYFVAWPHNSDTHAAFTYKPPR